MAAERYEVVVPLINRSCSLGTKIPIPLGSDTSVHTVRAGDLATISAHVPASRSVLNGNSKVILWSGLAGEPTESEII